MEEGQSNLFVALMNFIVSKIIVLLSVSDNFSLPYKYNLTSFWRKARLCGGSNGTTFSASVILLDA